MIFVVDSNDRERIGEANDELHKMVSHVASYSGKALMSKGKLYAYTIDMHINTYVDVHMHILHANGVNVVTTV